MFAVTRISGLSCHYSVSNFYRRLFSSFYKSSISLDKLYPNSLLSILAPVKVPDDPTCKFNGYIPIEKLKITYSRSSGPGGQHVNVVNTKVDIRFHVESAQWLDQDIRMKITKLYKSRMNKDGYLIVRSEKTRSRIYNQADAITILRNMIRTASLSLVPKLPSEETLAEIKRRQEKANMDRLFKKRLHSKKKTDRQDCFQL